MNAFDIIGPIMIGPSSSHTAGAVRIANIAALLLNEEVKKAVIKFHGSFACTYRGHGTDKAIVGGLMGFLPDDIRIRNSLKYAKKKGIEYYFETAFLKDAHPNTVFIEAVGERGKVIRIVGSSIGGGNILIKEINGLKVEFDGQNNTIIIQHTDKPGVVAFVTGLLGHNSINIANMKVYRTYKGGQAIMVIETDQETKDDVTLLIKDNPFIDSVATIKIV